MFNGHGLERGVVDTLIYHPDSWPGDGLICLGDDTANRGGNVHIVAKDAPASGLEDAKIWLVLSGDVDCVGATMTGWNPTEYLFEHNLFP